MTVELQSMDPKSVPLSSMSDVRIGSQTELQSQKEGVEEDEQEIEIPHINITYQDGASSGE